MWLQHNVVDVDGYAALAQRAASDPALQQAVAGGLTSQIGNLASTEVPTAVVGALASSYTGSSTFPRTIRAGEPSCPPVDVHQQRSVPTRFAGRGWTLAPMLADSSFQQTLSTYRIQVPQTLPVPLTENVPAAVRPGQRSGGDLGAVGQCRPGHCWLEYVALLTLSRRPVDAAKL